MSTPAQRRAQTMRAIELASNLAGIAPQPLQALALHESSGDYLAEHRLPADVRANVKAYQRERQRYAGNPFYDEAWRWSVGRGPFGQVVADNLHFIGSKRDPLALHDPTLAALAAVRRVVSLQAYRAKQGKPTNWHHVHRSWKYGNSEAANVPPAELAASDAKWARWLDEHGAAGMASENVAPWPQAGWSLVPTARDDRLTAAWRADLGELAKPKPPASSSNTGALLAFAAFGALAVIGGGAALAVGLRRGRR